MALLSAACCSVALASPSASARPAVNSAGPEPGSPGETPAETGLPTPPTVAFGGQYFAVTDKVMTGVDLRAGETWGGRVEANFLWTTDPIEEVDANFLGNHFGAFLELTPLRAESLSTTLGLGIDVFALWGIHGDLVELALATNLDVTYWVGNRFGVFLAARMHPFSSRGVELGTARDGQRTLPLLASGGLRWSLQ